MSKERCVCLALYDWENDFDIHYFHDLSLRFFAENNLMPDTGGLDTPDRSSTLKYRTIASRLHKNPSGPWIGMSLDHTRQDYHQLVFGWKVTSSLMCDDKIADFCCICDLGGIDLDYFDALLDEISAHVNLRYGIGYYRLFDLGPALFASGMVVGYGHSSEDLKASDRIGA